MLFPTLALENDKKNTTKKQKLSKDERIQKKIKSGIEKSAEVLTNILGTPTLGIATPQSTG